MPDLTLGPTTPLGGVPVRITRANAAPHDPAPVAGEPLPTLVRTEPLTAGEPPVDADRVAAIRRAIETGEYPILPAKISDAMIAASMLLQRARR